MISIPWILVTIFTFPGIVLRQIAHRFFCDLCGVPVYKVCYFRPANPSGYLINGKVNSLGKAILISFGPLILSSFLCMIITFPFVLPTFVLHSSFSNPSLWILGWLGLSIGMHAFPNSHDLKGIYEYLEESSNSSIGNSISKVLLKPLMIIGKAGAMLFFDLAYAIVLSFILPMIL